MTGNPDFGEKEFRGVGYPTPLSIPEETTLRAFMLPADGSWEALIMGVVFTLTFPENWQQFEGGITRQEAADRWLAVFESGYEPAEVAEVPAPYWEDPEDVDDQLPPAEQTWYGYVSDGNFVEDIGVWAVSNFLAATLSEKAAVLYATNQRKIRLAMFDGGLGGVVKVYANEILVKVIDMLGTGDIREVEVLTGYVDEAVDILTVLDTIAP